MTASTEEIAGRLYALPLAEFTAARDAAARELRTAGEREAAAEVKALRKPTAAAAAVNRLVRENRDEVEEFLRAAVVLRDAQFSGKGDLAAATRAEQEALERLLGAGGEATRQSLLAAAVDDEAARLLLEARLVRELEPRGFGTLLAHATPSGRRLEPSPKRAPAAQKQTPASQKQGEGPKRDEAPKRDEVPAPGRRAPASERDEAAAETAQASAADHEQRAGDRADPAAGQAVRAEVLRDARDALRDAKAALDAAEESESEARRRWERASADLERASAAAERAREALQRAKDALERAERHAGARDGGADRDS